jgi:hypothetical protein
MKPATIFLLSLGLATACQDTGLAPPSIEPEWAKAVRGPPPPEFTFRYPTGSGEMGSDCVLLPEPYHLFWCGNLPAEPSGPSPTLVFQVLRNGVPVGSSEGTVTFSRCENVETHKVVGWQYCGVRQGKGRDKWWDPFPFSVPVTPDVDGLIHLTLEGWGNPDPEVEKEQGVWGMRWEYHPDAGKASSGKWYSLVPDGFCNPWYPDCGPVG